MSQKMNDEELLEWVTVDDNMPALFCEDCAVPGCGNKRCARLASRFCYSHSNRPEDLAMKQIDAMSEASALETV